MKKLWLGTCLVLAGCGNGSSTRFDSYENRFTGQTVQSRAISIAEERSNRRAENAVNAAAQSVANASFTQTGRRQRATSVSTHAVGERVPFGVVGITCETPTSALGQQVDQFPRKGRAVWRLYDTNPNSTEPRTQYVTGFRDGCPRQFTAAVILFGAPRLHEVHRYSSTRAWSQADDVYEGIKTKACGVPRKAACPERKLNALEKRLSFVSVYPRFGATSGWLELLLHNGAVRSRQLR